jgi:hypothetical protein
MIKFTAAAIALCFAFSVTPADARHRHHSYRHHFHRTIDRLPVHAMVQCDNSGRTCDEAQASPLVRFEGNGGPKVASGYETFLPHPPGCPGRLFCGCGVSVKVFGHPVRDLFLAANWRRFPPASPSAGMVAWRWGHVMYIESANGDGTATVYDPNSGGHQTRVHTRSLAGYHIVNPNGARYASR